VVNDIMDLSRIEARKLEVRVAPCSLSDTLREAVGVVAARDRRHSVSLDVRFATPFPVAAEADAVRVRQIVTNLVASALDLTEEGQVVITAHCCQEPTPRLCVELFAPGVGLSEAQLQHLFEPFSQSLAASGHGHGDIGLGLSISRRLAILLEGELRVTTDLGRGTRFQVSLPVTWIAGTPWADASDSRTVPSPGPVDANSEHSKSREKPLTNSAGPIGPARPRILVAEDGPDNQRLIARVLKRIGAEIEMVSNGAQAADLALRNWRTGNTFDVVLMDMQMPVLDGYAATRRLRDAGYDGPIIALTAHAMSHDRQKCLGAGCTDFATKPLEIATLLDMIRRYAGNVAHVTSH